MADRAAVKAAASRPADPGRGPPGSPQNRPAAVPDFVRME
jgi:hypothetical protein